MLDPRYQYVLHTTSCEEQPLSDKSLSRFRKRCYDYESAYDVDLLHDCLTGLSGEIVKLMEINPRIKRMDSMMIAANIRKLSRIELLYTCVSKLVIYLHNNKKDALLKGMEHYYDPNDYNKTFYYNTSNETGSQVSSIHNVADKLLSLCAQNTMMLPSTSFWYDVFQSRTLSKKFPGAFAQEKTVDSIPKCSRILLIQIQPTE